MEKGYNVTITVESFHTEREFDVLEVFDGKNTKERIFFFFILLLLLLLPCVNNIGIFMLFFCYCNNSTLPSV